MTFDKKKAFKESLLIIRKEILSSSKSWSKNLPKVKVASRKKLNHTKVGKSLNITELLMKELLTPKLIRIAIRTPSEEKREIFSFERSSSDRSFCRKFKNSLIYLYSSSS